MRRNLPGNRLDRPATQVQGLRPERRAARPGVQMDVTEIFDADHYRRQIKAPLLDDAAALRHFLDQGDAAGLDPSAYIATRWYKQRYPDWAARGSRTAAGDFLASIGTGRQRQPHPLIDPDHYRASYPDLAGLGAAAALHFIRNGDGEGRSPSAGFDADFYRRCYLPLGRTHAFRHYITEGAALGHLPRPVPRNAASAQAAMRQAVAGLARPFLMVSHDAQTAGVPILTLDLARALRARGHDPVFLLGHAGPLAHRFRALGPVFIAAEGWDVAGLAAGLPPGNPAWVNTGAAAGLAAVLATSGLRCLVLLHEMADYLRGQGHIPGLRAAQAAGAQLIVSMPRMVQAFAPELGGQVTQILPGLVLPPTPLASFRQRRRHGGVGPVFIGAGHADHRKGFDLFLSAAARIAARRPQARFVWLGALDPWAQGLADAALDKGLPLALPGFVEDSLAWYRAADVYLLTSRQDPGPTTAIHAAAVGTPFVGYAADIGLVGLTDGACRFLPPGDEAGFVEAALEMASGISPETRRRLRRRVRAATSFDTYVDALLSQFDRAPDGAA